MALNTNTIHSPAPIASSSADPLDGARIRADFPVLTQDPKPGKPRLAFLDSAASSQKPQVVIDAISDYYEHYNANIHRGVYDISEEATSRYEGSRKAIARFINAKSAREVVFVRNTTEAINLVANSWGRANLGPGDLVVFTTMEHHSNIVPWQLIAQQTGARLGHVRITPDGRLDQEHYAELLCQEPKLVAFTHVSNSLGTVNPAKAMIAQAHAACAVTVVDGAQSVPHMAIDVQGLDCDFFAFSGHKMLGPMGAGILYGKSALLDSMPPFLGGGSMIRKVTLDQTTWADAPARFEAGTPAVADAIVLEVAAGYLTNLGMDRVWEHEQQLVAYALDRIRDVPGLTLYGPRDTVDRSGVLSFAFDGIHPHDVAAILNEGNVAVRAGHHCTQPLMAALGVPSTTRASFYVYNDEDDVDQLIDGLHRVVEVFR
jgi:cysteine desulfurase/selenocysteine lyase